MRILQVSKGQLLAAAGVLLFSAESPVAQVSTQCSIIGQLIAIEENTNFIAMPDWPGNVPEPTRDTARVARNTTFLIGRVRSQKFQLYIAEEVNGHADWAPLYLNSRHEFMEIYLKNGRHAALEFLRSQTFEHLAAELAKLAALTSCSSVSPGPGANEQVPFLSELSDSRGPTKGASLPEKPKNGRILALPVGIITYKVYIYLVMFVFFVALYIWGVNYFAIYRARCNRRYFCNVEVFVCGVRGKQKAHITSISRSGAGLKLGYSEQSNNILQISIDGSKKKARVIWANGKYTGVRFIPWLRKIPPSFEIEEGYERKRSNRNHARLPR